MTSARPIATQAAPRRAPILLALAAAALLAALVFAAIPVRTDITAFLPQGGRPGGAPACG